MSELPKGFVPYEVEIKISAVGYPPPHSNRAVPEMSDIAAAATRAARRVIEDAGYVISGTGHGSRRTDLP